MLKITNFFVLVMLNSRQSDKKAKCFALSVMIGQAVFTAPGASPIMALDSFDVLSQKLLS